MTRNATVPRQIVIAATILLVSQATSPPVHADDPGLAVLAPIGGETWIKGTTETIRWQAPAAVEAVDLHLWHAIVCVTQPCEQRPSTLYTIARDVPNTGRYEWTVPSLLQEIGLPPQGRYLVRLHDPETGQFADSAEPFRIVADP